MNLYEFDGNQYQTIAALANAMAVNWSEGRDFLLSGTFRARTGGSDKRRSRQGKSSLSQMAHQDAGRDQPVLDGKEFRGS